MEKKKKDFYTKSEIEYLHALIDEMNTVGGYCIIGVIDNEIIRGTAGIHNMAKATVANNVMRALNMTPMEMLYSVSLGDDDKK